MTWIPTSLRDQPVSDVQYNNAAPEAHRPEPFRSSALAGASTRQRGRVHLGPVSELHSVTDARARVRDVPGVPQRRARARRMSSALPLALLSADVAALTLESVLLGGPWIAAAAFGVLTLLARAAVRQYRPRLSLSVLDDLPRMLGSLVAALGLTVLVLVVIDGDHVHPGMLLQRAGAFFALSVIAQAVVIGLARHRRAQGTGMRRTLIVGGGRVADTLTDALIEHPELGLLPVGVVDPAAHPNSRRHPQVPLVATDLLRLAPTVVADNVHATILALGDGDAHVDTVIGLHQTGCQIFLVPPMFEMHHDGPDVERVRGVPLIRLRSDPTQRVSWWVKRGLDIVVAGLGLLVLAVPLAIISALVLLDSGRPIMFWQERVGLDGRRFRLCKFRSMRPASETESQTQWNIADDPRVSPIGRVLRKTSLDEIPQLWNILRGQMSLVGPRPERPTFVEKFTEEHERYWARHRVPVGLTGLAQVNGLRGDTSIQERARYDNYYIANWSLWLDAKIVLLTAREVFGGRGR